MEVKVTAITGKRFRSAEDVLSEARGRGMRWAPPVDVDGIASMLGASVYHDATLDQRGIIGEIKFSSSGPVIALSPSENLYEPRRRFTLAHELGHLCLHSDQRGGFTDSRSTMSRTESYWDKFETEANNFAAELLMPVELIITVGQEIWSAYRTRHGNDAPNFYMIDSLASRFEVSNQAMEYRLSNLDLLR
jgi:Zn-dependent peptidase ImmA (M78 family)